MDKFTQKEIIELLNKADPIWLSSADLSGLDLTGANFSEANLTNCSFRSAKLIKANLSGANLENTSFEEAVLTEARFSETILHNTSFIKATGSKMLMLAGKMDYETRFSEANLPYSVFAGSEIKGATFDDAILSNSMFNMAMIINGASFKGANLVGGDFREANFMGVNFKESNLRDAKFDTNFDLVEQCCLFDGAIMPDGKTYIPSWKRKIPCPECGKELSRNAIMCLDCRTLIPRTKR